MTQQTKCIATAIEVPADDRNGRNVVGINTKGGIANTNDILILSSLTTLEKSLVAIIVIIGVTLAAIASLQMTFRPHQDEATGTTRGRLVALPSHTVRAKKILIENFMESFQKLLVKVQYRLLPKITVHPFGMTNGIDCKS